ncbi:metal-binding protein [Trichocoleus desertorum AS-A10]|uniref:metal-binding protein n=1 Tax=Trichocoleus desertorum TaxID=1481672 RepID=UPI0032992ECE
MASGEVHDRTTWMGAAGLGLAIWTATNSFEQTTWAIAGCLFGGLMFSPDLDLKSKPWRRWGLLRWIWTPYQAWVPHRSFLSHTPIVGTLIKLLYLGFPVAIACVLMGVKIDLETANAGMVAGGWFFLGGVEAGCCIHLLMDWLSSK